MCLYIIYMCYKFISNSREFSIWSVQESLKLNIELFISKVCFRPTWFTIFVPKHILVSATYTSPKAGTFYIGEHFSVLNHSNTVDGYIEDTLLLKWSLVLVTSFFVAWERVALFQLQLCCRHSFHAILLLFIYVAFVLICWINRPGPINLNSFQGNILAKSQKFQGLIGIY